MNAEKLVAMNVGPNLTSWVQALALLGDPCRIEYEEAGKADIDESGPEGLYDLCERYGDIDTPATLAGFTRSTSSVYEWVMALSAQSKQAEIIRQYLKGKVQDWKLYCRRSGVRNFEDYETPVLEYWQVSDQIAEKLESRGEMVVTLLGVTVWGRCTSGQAIKMDSVIQDIAEGTHD